jgi:hypothetical protein
MLVSNTVPPPQMNLTTAVLIDTPYPTSVLPLSLAHTHTHTHTDALVATRLDCFFFCQSYIMLITSLELFHTVLVQERIRYMSYLLLVHEHSGGMLPRDSQETMLPGATALCYNTFKIAESVPWALATISDLNISEACWQLVHCVTNI